MSLIEKLTPRQRECIVDSIKCKRSSDIGKKQNVADRVVIKHLQRARKKFGAATTTGLVVGYINDAVENASIKKSSHVHPKLALLRASERNLLKTLVERGSKRIAAEEMGIIRGTVNVMLHNAVKRLGMLSTNHLIAWYTAQLAKQTRADS